jgi:PPM family protein phosphatase
MLMVGGSHQGLVRSRNEDSFWFDNKKNIAVIADGLGGHQRGDLASQMVVDYIKENADLFSGTNDVTDFMRQLILNINTEVMNKAYSEPSLYGMSSTVACLYYIDDTVYIANVGDSRVYLIVDNKIWQLTIDHNIGTSLQRKLISKDKIPNTVSDKALTNVVGSKSCMPDVFTFKVNKNYLFLAATDGVFNMLNTKEILKIVTQSKFENLVDAIISKANHAGGVDNITAIGCLV